MAQQSVTFNTNNLQAGVIEKGVGSLNACWLMDSDEEPVMPRNVSNESRFVEMGIGSLRFPYGQLANNYLWDTPPYGGTLVPKISAQDRFPAAGNSVSNWATNANGTFKNDMDFDEYMGICERNNIKPIVVINIMSHFYNDGVDDITYEELIEVAVEWVKYAKAKNYDVAYWQIGNEADHNHNLEDFGGSAQNYANLYKDFVIAMKAVDPTIKCGTGILSRTAWTRAVLDLPNSSSLVDFVSTHQYLFGRPIGNYVEWLNHDGSDLNSNIKATQAILDSRGLNIPILVTESNSFGNWDTNSPALYKGLSWFDLLITQQENKNVGYTYMWNSHSLWGGANGDGGLANALFNDAGNKITAMGWAMKILNDTAEERPMIPDDKVHGKTYSYGNYTPSTGNMTIYLMNKNTTATQMSVTINNYDTSTDNYERWVWKGTSKEDLFPTFTKTGAVAFTDNGFTTSVPAHSLVVIKLKSNNGDTSVSAGNAYYINNVATNNRIKSNPLGTGIEPAPRPVDLGWLGKWKLINAGEGYFYIENVANKMRLQGTGQTGEAGITIVPYTYNGDWVKWKLTKIGNNYYVDNKAHNSRLSNGEDFISVGTTGWRGNWSQWRFTDAAITNKEISSTEKINNITMYPNPATNVITINNAANSTIHVYDINGSRVLTANILSNSETINLNSLATGIYYAKVQNTNTISTLKFVKK
ncbi:hypothetical protein GCM10022393_16980 [Aquimarina addita]|uniref:Uncharacterized protein n=2 Tax=Aquimarina addita TaxID=870485 RepID=A0ABP7XGW4_9FLAO